MRVAAVLALVAFLGAGHLLGSLDQVRPRGAGRDGARYLDLVRHARPALLGYDALAADVVWIQAIQLIAERVRARRDFEGLYDYLDAVTELDPKYAQVYEIGATVLVAMDRRPDEAIRLLEKGYRALPDDWHVPYLLAYTYLFYYQDYARAAGYLEDAARRVGRATYMTGLAARLRAQSGSPEAALSFLEGMRRQTADPAVRREVEQRMGEIVIDRDLKTIAAAVERYRAAHRRLPETVRVLVHAGLLPVEPREPFGGVYRIDPETGEVSSSSGKGLLRTYRHPRAPEPQGDARE